MHGSAERKIRRQQSALGAAVRPGLHSEVSHGTQPSDSSSIPTKMISALPACGAISPFPDPSLRLPFGLRWGTGS